MINGLVLTIVGMLTVFAFLIVMVLAMSLLRRVAERWLPSPSAAAAHPAAEIALAVAAAHDARLRGRTPSRAAEGEGRRS